MSKDKRYRHGYCGQRVYNICRGIVSRCTDPKNHKYPRYGGRGIKVHDDWLSSYKNMVEYFLSSGYTDGLQVDRIDNDGNYEPGNIRFVDQITNMRNSSATKLTKEDAHDIKFMLSKGMSCISIGNIFKVNRSTISDIKSNRTWRDVV